MKKSKRHSIFLTFFAFNSIIYLESKKEGKKMKTYINHEEKVYVVTKVVSNTEWYYEQGTGTRYRANIPFDQAVIFDAEIPFEAQSKAYREKFFNLNSNNIEIGSIVKIDTTYFSGETSGYRSQRFTDFLVENKDTRFEVIKISNDLATLKDCVFTFGLLQLVLV